MRTDPHIRREEVAGRSVMLGKRPQAGTDDKDARCRWGAAEHPLGEGEDPLRPGLQPPALHSRVPKHRPKPEAIRPGIRERNLLLGLLEINEMPVV